MKPHHVIWALVAIGAVLLIVSVLVDVLWKK